MGGGPGTEPAAQLRPVDRFLLQRLQRVLEALSEPTQVTVHTAIHAVLDLALAYRRDRDDRPGSDDGSFGRY